MDCGFAGAVFWRKVLGNVIGDLVKGHPVDPGRDERLQPRGGINLGGTLRAVMTAVVGDRIGGGF